MDENLVLTCINKIELSSSTSRKQRHEFQIKFKFSRICFSNEWVSSTGDNPRKTETIATKQEECVILNNLQDLLVDDNRARQLMREKLCTWNRVDDRQQQLWIETALENGRDVVQQMPASHNSVSIRVSVLSVFITPPTPPPNLDTKY